MRDDRPERQEIQRPTTDQHHPGRAIVLVGLVVLAALLSTVPPAEGQQPPFSRGLAAACPDGVETLRLFPDGGGPHGAAIDCIAYLGIVRGRSSDVSAHGRVYDPDASVTRAQMASFVVGAMEFVTGEDLPMGDGFPDVSGIHEDSVRKLARAGVVRGLEDGTYAPATPVTREQMASFVAGAIEQVVGTELPTASVFPDVSGTHRQSVEKLAAVGIVQGRADGSYGPGQPVTRAQMATFIAQSLAEIADRGVFPAEPVIGVVSTFTTPLVPGQSRNTNIHLAADNIDGDVIPGEVSSYSLNEGIGQRTRARGFVGNGFIDDDGEVISVVGGGVSQMATTFMNAAWFAGIQIDEFRQHTIYFDRYPMCREATLVWNSLDVVVTNGSPYDITIDTSYTDDSVTVSFLSRPWADVDSWIGPPTDVTSGIGGSFSVACGRTITYPDGTSWTQEVSWRYDEGYPG